MHHPIQFAIVRIVNSTFSTFNSFLNSNLLQNVEKAVSMAKETAEKIDCAQKILRSFSFWSATYIVAQLFASLSTLSFSCNLFFVVVVLIVIVVVVEMWHSFRAIPLRQSRLVLSSKEINGRIYESLTFLDLNNCALY